MFNWLYKKKNIYLEYEIKKLINFIVFFFYLFKPLVEYDGLRCNFSSFVPSDLAHDCVSSSEGVYIVLGVDRCTCTEHVSHHAEARSITNCRVKWCTDIFAYTRVVLLYSLLELNFIQLLLHQREYFMVS